MKVRFLVSVSGHDFSRIPGEVVDLPEEEALKWADGERAVFEDTADDQELDEQDDESKDDEESEEEESEDEEDEESDESEEEAPAPKQEAKPKRKRRR